MDFITTHWALILKIIGVPGLYGFYRLVIKPFVIKPIIKSILDEEIGQYRDDTIRYMNDTIRYMNDARDDKQEIEQIKEVVARYKEEITTKAETINSLLSSTQAQETLQSLGKSADADNRNAQILEEYLEP